METATQEMKMRMCCLNNNNKGTLLSSMEVLPTQVLWNILLRLPSDSLHCLKCVSKTLLSTINDKSFIAEHNCMHAQGKAAVEVPRLMAHINGSVVMTSISSSRCLQPIEFPRRSMKRLKNGSRQPIEIGLKLDLLFVYRNLFYFTSWDEKHSFLVDPLRCKGEVLRLPESSNMLLAEGLETRASLCINYYGMGFDKKTYMHKIVRVSRFYVGEGEVRTEKVVALVLDLGKSLWRRIASVPPLGRNRLCHGGVDACGDMHWLKESDSRGRGAETTQRSLVSFDFSKEEFSWSPLPPTLSYSFKNTRLFTFRGALILAETSSLLNNQDMSRIKIWVLKDYDNKVWMPEYDIDIDFNCEHGRKQASGSGEWEHGIFFDYQDKVYPISTSVRLFLDFRYTPVKCFAPSYRKTKTSIVSYTGSLISLQSYGNLVDVEELVRGFHF